MYRSRHVNTPNNSYPKDCQRACVPLTDLPSLGGRRATMKALPATPPRPRPYGKGLEGDGGRP